MLNKNTETFIACDADFDEAKAVLFGAPFDGTTSFRAGTRFAPHAVRSDSFAIETYSPYQDADLEDFCIMDSGDLELCFGNAKRVLCDIEERAKIILDADKIPFMIGGEHLVTLGAFRAVYEKYPDVCVVHFDAHTDLRDEYMGEKLSHATVLRRIHDITGDGKIYQFGIRSGERDEFYWSKNHTYMNKFNFDTLEETVDKLRGKKVYFTLDMDVLDPSVFSGTGTPEYGGVSFDELRRAATLVCSELDIVGCDVNELSPHYDASGASTAAACKIIREMLIALLK